MGFELLTEPGKAQRATFLGHQGSGKTTLVQAFLANVESAVVFDSKHVDSEWRAFAKTHGYVITPRVADIRKHAKVIFRVDYRSLADRSGWATPGRPGHAWTEALQAVMWRGSTVVVFDEAMHTLTSAASHVEARRMVTQGRAMGLACWMGTQAPIYVDTVALAESEHLFSFAQPNPEYRAVIRSRRGVDAEELAGLGKFEFAYHRAGAAAWDQYDPITPIRKRTTRDDSSDNANAVAPHPADLTPAS